MDYFDNEIEEGEVYKVEHKAYLSLRLCHDSLLEDMEPFESLLSVRYECANPVEPLNGNLMTLFNPVTGL